MCMHACRLLVARSECVAVILGVPLCGLLLCFKATLFYLKPNSLLHLNVLLLCLLQGPRVRGIRPFSHF
jgi:hypothetical protein